MPHNLPQAFEPAQPRWFALPGHGVLELSGPDAIAFAQAQCMNDVAALGDLHWQWNGWLTPKGRLVALFALLRLDGERLWLVLPDYPAAALGDRLRRFVFRSRLALRVRDDLRPAGAFAAPARASGPEAAILDGGVVELDLGAGAAQRSLRIGAADVGGDERDAARWRAFDVAHGLPRLPEPQSEQFTPQMLSLERLRAFSVRKGCYPGQEIVARTHFLGQSKRGLVLLESDLPLPEGAQVGDGTRAIGSVASGAREQDRHLALAVLPNDRGPSLQVDGRPVSERPLREGLGR